MLQHHCMLKQAGNLKDSRIHRPLVWRTSRHTSLAGFVLKFDGHLHDVHQDHMNPNWVAFPRSCMICEKILRHASCNGSSIMEQAADHHDKQLLQSTGSVAEETGAFRQAREAQHSICSKRLLSPQQNSSGTKHTQHRNSSTSVQGMVAKYSRLSCNSNSPAMDARRMS